MKSWLEDNNAEMYSMNNEEKYVVAQRFIIILRTKFINARFKYQIMCTMISQMPKLTNTYHRSNKLKPVDVDSTIYVDSNK